MNITTKDMGKWCLFEYWMQDAEHSEYHIGKIEWVGSYYPYAEQTAIDITRFGLEYDNIQASVVIMMGEKIEDIIEEDDLIETNIMFYPAVVMRNENGVITTTMGEVGSDEIIWKIWKLNKRSEEWTEQHYSLQYDRDKLKEEV